MKTSGIFFGKNPKEIFYVFLGAFVWSHPTAKIQGMSKSEQGVKNKFKGKNLLKSPEHLKKLCTFNIHSTYIHHDY